MSFNWIKSFRSRSEMGHGFQTKISHISLPGLNKFPKLSRDLYHQVVFCIEVDEKIDGFEKNSILGIILLYILWLFCGGVHYHLERFSDNISYVGVL